MISNDSIIGSIEEKENLTGSLNNSGVLIQTYTLPVASVDTLGGIKVGANLSIEEDGTLNAIASSSAAGTTDYMDLTNKPSINNVELTGNKTLAELGIQASGDYANKSDIPKKTSQLTNDSGFLTKVPSEYVTDTELNAKGYLTKHQDISNLATKNELHSHSNKSVLDNISQTTINNWNNKSNFSGSYNDLINKPTIPTKVSQLTNDNSYASESYVTNAIANAQLGGGDSEIDLSGYATKDDLINKVDKVTGKSLIADSEITRLAGLNNYDDTEIKNTLKTKADTSAIPTKVSQLSNDKGYLTGVPSEYVTENELIAKGYLTEHQDISNLATKGELHSHSNKTILDSITVTNINNWNAKSEFSGSYNDLTNKPTIPTIPANVSSFTNDVGYLTSIPSEYVTETELNEAIENIDVGTGNVSSDVINSIVVVDVLPEIEQDGVLYLVKEFEIEEPTIEYVINPTMEMGKISSSTGALEESSEYCRTADYVYIKGKPTLTLSNSIDASMNVVCYDENKNFMTNWLTEGESKYSYKRVSSGGTFTFPEDAYYIKLRFSSTEIVEVTITYE